MPKDFYKKDKEIPGGVNRAIPTADHAPSSLGPVKNPLTAGNDPFPKQNAGEGNKVGSHTGPYSIKGGE